MTDHEFGPELTAAILRLWQLAPGHVRRQIQTRLDAGEFGTTVHPVAAGIAEVRICGVPVGRIGVDDDGTPTGESVTVWN